MSNAVGLIIVSIQSYLDPFTLDQILIALQGAAFAVVPIMHQNEEPPREAFKDGDDFLPPLPSPLRAPVVSASTNLNAESLKPAAASLDDMTKTLLGMMEDMRLNEQEVVALRRAISHGDANISGALMVFK